jgi:recombination DNA repair RAD52 pathway protein
MQREYQPLTDKQVRTLVANLNPQRIAKRSGGRGAQLSYLEAYDVKATLIRVFGFGEFSAETTENRIVDARQVAGKNGAENWNITVMTTVRLEIFQTGAVFIESAAHTATNSNYGEALDMAIKTSSSDALKRCAIYLGTQFGLSLYDNGATNDVVRVVMAPTQTWPPANPNQEQQPQRQAPPQADPATLVANLTPSTPAEAPVRFENVTDEQRSEGEALVAKALRVKAEKEAAHKPGQTEHEGAVQAAAEALGAQEVQA